MKKDFKLGAILGLTTGVLLEDGKFGEIHELAEHVVGHSIWTHEFAEKALWAQLKDVILAEHPQLIMPTDEFSNGGKRTGPECAQFLREQERIFGKTLQIAKGTGERAEHPISSLHRISGGRFGSDK